MSPMVFQNRNTALQTITLSTDTPNMAMSPTTPLYMLNGLMRKCYLASGTIDLDPAFAATTQYIKGACIVNGGNIYAAKTTFTSASAFDANDWYLVDANSMPTGTQRFYVVGLTYDASTGDHTMVLKAQAAETDPVTLTPAEENVEFNFAQAVNTLAEEQDFAVVGYFLIRNQSGSAFVPGTTATGTSDVFIYFGSMDSESDE